MTEAKSKTAKLGSSWDLGLKKGDVASITRPDGRVLTVSRGPHVLDLAGEYVAVVGDTELKVTAK